MKKLIAAFLALAVLTPAVVSGCAGPETQSGEPEESSGPVNLMFFWWGSQPRHDATIKVTELYTKTHPNVTFTNEYQSMDGYFDKLSMRAAANNMPDVFQFSVGASQGSQFIDKKLVEPLDGYVSKKAIDLSSLSESTISTGKLDGKLYGLILGTNALALAVDPSAYQKAGLTVPEDGYDSWESIGKDLAKLKAATGAYGADDILWLQDIINYWSRQHGTSEFGDDGIAFSKETYVELMTLVKQWMDQGLIPPLDVAAAGANNAGDSQLAQHKAAMSLIHTNQLQTVSKAFGGDLQLIPLPGPNAQKAMYLSASQHIVMASTSKNKDAAAAFMNYFINDIDANKILNAERGIPAQTKVLEALKPGFAPALQIAADYVEKVSKTAGSTPPPDPSYGQDIYTMLDDLQEQIIYGKISSEDAYAQLAEKSQQDAASAK